MPKDYREITITITEGEDIAYVWTNIPAWRKRILKLGGVEKENVGGQFIHAPAAIFWPRRRRQGKEGIDPKSLSPAKDSTPRRAIPAGLAAYQAQRRAVKAGLLKKAGNPGEK